MSRGLICDQCQATLAVDKNGEDALGESAAWIAISTTFGRFDLCTRACAVALIESEGFADHVDACLQAVADVIREIRDSDE